MNVDTFGNLINQTGSSTGNLGFQSKYYDQESELNYYYHRYYYPVIGRFINEDPIGFNGGLNMYGFTNNNPINDRDLFGLFGNPQTEITLIGGIPTGPGYTIPIYLIEIVNYDRSGNRNVLKQRIGPFPFNENLPNDCFLRCFADCMYARFWFGEATKRLVKLTITKIIEVSKGIIKLISISALRYISPISYIITAVDILNCYNKCKHLL